jgi:hypothetical protein
MSNKSAHVGPFFPDRGWRFFIPNIELAEFRAYLAKANPHDRDYYNLNCTEEPTTGGAFYYLGRHRTGEEMHQFLIDWTIRKG